MDKDESKKLLGLLDEAIHHSRRSRRSIERSLGLSQGYLGSLFKGRIELKVWHVYSISREIGAEPITFFLQASPPKDPAGLLEQLGASIGPATRDGVIPEPPSLSSRDIEDLVRKTVRSELARLAGADEVA